MLTHTQSDAIVALSVSWQDETRRKKHAGLSLTAPAALLKIFRLVYRICWKMVKTKGLFFITLHCLILIAYREKACWQCVNPVGTFWLHFEKYSKILRDNRNLNIARFSCGFSTARSLPVYNIATTWERDENNGYYCIKGFFQSFYTLNEISLFRSYFNPDFEFCFRQKTALPKLLLPRMPTRYSMHKFHWTFQKER